jgi:hypothetical protein
MAILVSTSSTRTLIHPRFLRVNQFILRRHSLRSGDTDHRCFAGLRIDFPRYARNFCSVQWQKVFCGNADRVYKFGGSTQFSDSGRLARAGLFSG